MSRVPDRMRGWRTQGDGRLELEDLPVPRPADDEVLVRVIACGVCRTDLHVRDGDLAPHRAPVIPGHEVVGQVVDTGARTVGSRPGDLVGIAWLRSTCGGCHWCRRGRENLCPDSTYTGWDHDGGYAEYAVAPEAYTYRLPADADAEQTAPLLCAGIIGYRALRRARVPAGGRLGIYGFGGSAHLTAQLALAEGAEVHVLTRDAAARDLALALGVASVGGAYEEPPVPLDSAIVFAPVGDLVPVALAALDQDGTVAVAGIHLSDIPVLQYQRHLFREKTLTSVTANTRADGEDMLRLARRHGVRATVSPYPFERADAALEDLAHDRVRGAAVLRMGWRGVVPAEG